MLSRLLPPTADNTYRGHRLALFAAWGLAQVMLNLIGLLVLVRYRSLVAFAFLVLLVEHVARRVVFWMLPLPRAEHAPGWFINMALIVVMVVGFVLALPRGQGSGP